MLHKLEVVLTAAVSPDGAKFYHLGKYVLKIISQNKFLEDKNLSFPYYFLNPI
jgi:hypothetical protein